MYHWRDGEIVVCSCRLFVKDIIMLLATESDEWCVHTRRQQWAARNTVENMVVTKSEQVRKQYSAIMDDSRVRTRKEYLRDHCVTIPNTLHNVCKKLSVLQ